MAFVYNNNQIESFAEYQDVLETDSRLFGTNEGLSESSLYPFLIKSTDRIINKIKMSRWYENAKLTSFDPLLIISKQQYFTDMTVYHSLYEFILPYIADFGNQDTEEFQKIQYYKGKFEQLLDDMLTASDWYDINQNNVIDVVDVKSVPYNRRRVR